LRLDFLPDFDFLVIATSSKQVLVLRVSPLYLPWRAYVSKRYS
jgi:hypothetical protein